jgi:TRAP-type C4-dicarboxylate transport system substrate-binding protein
MKGASNMTATLKVIISAFIFWGLVAQPAIAQDVYKFKIAIDTVMDHPLAQGLLIFMEDIKNKSNGRLAPELFHSAQLYRGADIPKALKLGTLEMGLPATGYLSAFDVNSNMPALPIFFGRPPEVTRSIADGEWGKAIAKSLEQRLGVKVLMPFFELGYVHHLIAKRPVEKMQDFKGLKIRYPASPEFALNIKALGGSPIQIALSDLPMALLQGTVDGTITNFKGADATKLDEAGVKYAVKDNISLTHYVPMFSIRFWNSLPKDLQKIIVEASEAVVPKQRQMSDRMQEDGEMNLEKRGVKIYRPTQEELKKWRQYIMPAQAPFVKEMKYDEELIKLIEKKMGL